MSDFERLFVAETTKPLLMSCTDAPEGGMSTHCTERWTVQVENIIFICTGLTSETSNPDLQQVGLFYNRCFKGQQWKTQSEAVS